MSHLACEQVLWQKFKHQTSKTHVIAELQQIFFFSCILQSFFLLLLLFCNQITKTEVEQF